MRRMRTLLPLLLIPILALSGCVENEPKTIRIGVLITMSGDDYDDYRAPLEWARDNINAHGGVDGRKIELVYGDLGGACGDDVEAAARKFAEDDSIVAVIGPEWSDQVLQVGEIFKGALKPMVSPEATADEISFTFRESRYVWRTVEPDMAQIKIQLYLARTVHHAETVALLTDNGPYGRTFFNWFGFFAEELGLKVTAMVKTDYQWCEADADDAVVGQPDVLIAVPRVVQDAICTVETLRTSSPETSIIFADGARFPALINELSDAEGLEGTSPAPAKLGTYAEDYEARFGTAPGAFSSNLYDAVLLIAYGLERSQGATGRDLADAMRDVVMGRGQRVSWDREGIGEGLRLIREATSPDDLPDITGASGPLEYDEESWVDPKFTTYAHWRVEDGEFVTVKHYTTDDASGNVDSVFTAVAGEGFKSDIAGQDIQLPAQTGSWAVIVAASRYWGNYRHQADALAQYKLLKDNGFSDDRIILIVENDLAYDWQNPLQGTVRNEPSSDLNDDPPNLYAELTPSSIDYKISNLTPDEIMDIIAGRQSPNPPKGPRRSRPVVDSTATDNIYLFWVGHGNTSGLTMDAVESDSGSNDGELSPELLADTLEYMEANQRFRQFLIVIEACHSGAMGEEVELRQIPGVLVMTGARRNEPSYGANPDPDVGEYIANKFAYEFWKKAMDDPAPHLSPLYSYLYSNVTRSHVSAFNAAHFGDMARTGLDEFITPP